MATRTVRIRPVGPRDPNWLFGFHQRLIVLGALFYLGLFCWPSLGFRPGHALIVMIVYFVAETLLSIRERLSDQAAVKQRGLDADVATGPGFTIRGRPGEVKRILDWAKRCSFNEQHFSTGLRAGHQWMLWLLLFVVFPVLALVAGVSPFVISLIMAISALLVGAHLFLFRLRYSICDGQLVISRMCGWKVTGEETLRLRGARLECDFCEGSILIAGDDGHVKLLASELIAPHKFVSGVLAVVASQ